MGYESREYRDGWEEEGAGGRVRAFFRRVFGDGENPLMWAVPLYRAWGIEVKLHIIFIIVIIVRLIWSLRHDQFGFTLMLIAMGGLFVLVLLHEYGHCIACRRVGGTADQIIMWPLGGLAVCAPPPHWRADLITTIGGPAVNVLLVPVFALALLAVVPGGQVWQTLVFNPLDPVHAIGALRLADGTTPVWLLGLWFLYYLNGILLAFNLLVPMYPMDGARIVHALMWRKMGHRRATSIVVIVGLVAAIVLFIIGMMESNGLLMGLAVFGALICWFERRRLKMTEDPVLSSLPGYDFDKGYMGMPDVEDDRPSRAEEKRRKREEEEQAEVDRILAKIADQGMGSLTRGERRRLERATQRKRGA